MELYNQISRLKDNAMANPPEEIDLKNFAPCIDAIPGGSFVSNTRIVQ